MQASPAQQGAPPKRSAADAQELMKQIVARMPTDKADVFAYPIAWAAYDGAVTMQPNRCVPSPFVCALGPECTIPSAGLTRASSRHHIRTCRLGLPVDRSTRSLCSYRSLPCRMALLIWRAKCGAGIGPEGKKKMSQWVTKTIKELLGEEEQTLVRTASDDSFHVGRQPNCDQPSSRGNGIVASAGDSVLPPDSALAEDHLRSDDDSIGQNAPCLHRVLPTTRDQ